MEPLKSFLLHKLTLRVVYIAAAYGSSHLVDFISNQRAQDFLKNIFIDPTLKPGAVDFLKASLGMVIMIGGEFVFHALHTKFVLPHVSGEPVIAPAPEPIAPTPEVPKP